MQRARHPQVVRGVETDVVDGARTAQSAGQLSVTTQFDLNSLDWTNTSSSRTREVQLQSQEQLTPALQNIALDPLHKVHPEEGAASRESELSTTPCSWAEMASTTKAAAVENKPKSGSPQSSTAELEALVSVDVSPASGDTKQSHDDCDGDSTAGERRSKRSVQPAQKLRDADFVVDCSVAGQVAAGVAGGAAEEPQTPPKRTPPTELKVKKLGKSILDAADKFPWQAVEDPRREVWAAFHNRVRASSDVDTIRDQLLWMISQIDDCVLENDWEEKDADWKARCQECGDIDELAELWQEYHDDAVDWNATNKLFLFEKEEERRKLGRKTLGKKKVPRIQQPRPLRYRVLPRRAADPSLTRDSDLAHRCISAAELNGGHPSFSRHRPLPFAAAAARVRR